MILLGLLLVLSTVFAFFDAAATANDQTFEGWACDDILAPDLCPLRVQSGVIPIRGINVRYWTYRLANGTADTLKKKLPVVILHGGPSFPHDYLLPLKKLACDGRHVIFYDQAGCSESRLPSNNGSQSIRKDYPWLLDPAYYALEELPALLQHLAIDHHYHLLGHSWGTMLAQLFALNASSPLRDGLASMVLSGPMSDSQLYIQEQWDPTTGTLGTLPPFVQERIKSLEGQKAYDSSEYKALDDVMTTLFICRTAPLPDCYQKSVNNMNREIYVGMQGASEFANAGVLADFNTTDRLCELNNIPIMLSSGMYDTVRPRVVQVMQDRLALSERVFFERSGHVSAIDEAILMNQVVSDFFNRVEASIHLQQGFIPRNKAIALNEQSDGELQRCARPQTRWIGVICTAVAFMLGVLVMHLWRNQMPSCSLSGYDEIHDADPSVIAASSTGSGG